MAIRPFKGVMPNLGKGVYVDPQASVIGQVTMGQDCSVWPSASIRGDILPIVIGNRTNIQDGAALHTTSRCDLYPDGFGLTMGDDVVIGHCAVVHGATLGDRVLVGMNAVVLDGAVVEDDVFIAAGCIVLPGMRLESGNLYVGSPARKARSLTEGEKAYIEFDAKDYVTLKNAYMEDV